MGEHTPGRRQGWDMKRNRALRVTDSLDLDDDGLGRGEQRGGERDSEHWFEIPRKKLSYTLPTATTGYV